MNRIDRLVATILLLQSHRVITASKIAEQFEITERTVYRDLAALGEAGVPILAEPGLGYSLMRGYHLPPVVFSSEEAFALVTAGTFAETTTDASVKAAMRSALRKIHTVVPAELQRRFQRLGESTLVDAPRGQTRAAVPLTQIQKAVAESRVLLLNYHGGARGEGTSREIEPLGLAYYLEHWHLIAWCRLREDVRDFRIDRIKSCAATGEQCAPRPGFDLREYAAKASQPDEINQAVIEIAPALREIVHRQFGQQILEEKPLAKRLRLTVSYWNREIFAQWLLTLGTDVVIRAPDDLRSFVADVARSVAEHHAEK